MAITIHTIIQIIKRSGTRDIFLQLPIRSVSNEVTGNLTGSISKVNSCSVVHYMRFDRFLNSFERAANF